MSARICDVEGCVRAHIARGLCTMHYERLMRLGTVERRSYGLDSLAERLTSGLVRKPSGCLEWRTAGGYGSITVGDKKFSTHRLAWEFAHGPIPDGMHVCHHCDNPPCCETAPSDAYPEGHLFLGTRFDNMRDMVAKGRWAK